MLRHQKYLLLSSTYYCIIGGDSEIMKLIETLKNHSGNAGIIAAVVSIVAVIVVLIMGAIITGSFSTMATSANLNLSEDWLSAVNGISTTAVTTFNIAGMIPIAIVASIVIAVIGGIIISRT